MRKQIIPNTGGKTSAERKLHWQQRLVKTELALLMIDEVITPALISGPALYGLRQEWGRALAKHKRDLYKTLWYLEKQGLILRQGKTLQATQLTDKGRRRIVQLAIDLAEPPRLLPWDGRWHMIIFDVPESHRIGRDLLRNKLYQLGCVQLQRSVFVFPYNIRDWVERIRGAYDLRTDINYLIVEALDRQEELIELFRERGILPQ